MSSRMRTQRLGEFFAFGHAFLGSFVAVLSTMSFLVLSPLQCAWITTGIAAIVFGFIVTVRGAWRWDIPFVCVRDILIAGIGIGFLYHGMFFIGLKNTTPGNAAIIGLMEVFFTFLFLNILTRHEPLIRPHLAGAMLMVVAALIVLLPGLSSLRWGDVVILVATTIPPFANAAQQRARRHVSASLLLFWRSAIATAGLFLMAHFVEGPLQVSWSTRLFTILIFNGIFAYGLSKVFWVEAIHRIPITKTIAFACIQPLLTMIFAFLFLRQTATMWQMISFIPMALGMIVLTRKQTTMEAADIAADPIP